MRTMINQTESGEGKLYFQSLQFIGEQGDAVNQQFVSPRQCLILGDSEVGKTSLVKSLTGKPFDPKQQKTQGIDQCLVNNEWKNCNLKDLIFGDLWKFLESGVVEVLLSTTGKATVAQEFMFIIREVWKIPVISIFTGFLAIGLLSLVYNFPVTIFSNYFIYFFLVLFQQCAIHCNITSKLRFILVTFISILSRRVLLIGSHLALVICYFDESFVESVSCAFPVLGSIAGIAFVVLVILIGPIQMPLFDTSQLVKRQNFIVILCFYRLLLSIFIGLIIGFAAAESLGAVSDKKSLREILVTCSNNMVSLSIITPFVVNSPTEFVIEFQILKCKYSSMEDEPWGPCGILLILALFYHFKLAITSPIYYFAITYPLFICLTLCKEWLRINLIRSFSECSSNKYMTLAVMGIGEMDKRMLKSALQEKFPSPKLHILDFAGDKEYYAYHHMFLKSNALYVIVFNIAMVVKDSFKNVNTEIERLQFWLESVCSHVPPKTPIVLVGTHRGDLGKTCMQILNGHLSKNLWVPYCDELVVNDDDELMFFPVENSNGENDVGVQRLRIKLTSVAEEREAARECDIPLSWITIQDAIISRREKKKAKFCVTLEEFPTAFDNFTVCTNWPEETLKYFHEKGLVIYLDKDQDLSNWVLLKPEILVDVIIQFVTPPPPMAQERGFRRDWKLLHDKGMLTKPLLTRIISTVQENKEAMTAFLENYDLICPLLNNKVKMCSLYDDEENQPTHFVPSLLPMSAEGCIPTWHDNTTDKTFYVFFNRFLPEPLFHRLLSRAHKNSKVEFPNGPVVMFKDVGKFWMSPWQPYRLRLMKEEAIIEVTFSSSNTQGMKPADVLCQVFSMVDGICKRDFSFVKFHCGPACPSHDCPGYQDNYMYTSYQHNRRHVYNVMPGRQGDNIASLYCVNNSFEEELEEWIP